MKVSTWLVQIGVRWATQNQRGTCRYGGQTRITCRAKPVAAVAFFLGASEPRENTNAAAVGADIARSRGSGDLADTPQAARHATASSSHVQAFEAEGRKILKPTNRSVAKRLAIATY